MLGPHDRRLLLDALRPPTGYALDFALGTTYSLDLLALLTAPLAFTLFDWQDAEGRPTADPLATLEALRRYADKIAVFCQAGQTLVPRQHRILFGYLEGSVFEVTAPETQASFHPKFWALRFTAPGEPVRYRLLNLSRNLTFDRSWDTALVLEGTYSERKNAFTGNHRLGDFVAALPGMARQPFPAATLSRVEQCAYELRRMAVELPEDFEELWYHPLGVNGPGPWPFPDRCDRVLVVSPFLSQSFLNDITDAADEVILVSRLESLQEMEPEALEAFSAVYALSPSADVEESQAGGDTEEAESLVPPHEELPLSGLHAKLYIVESGGWNASVFTGSANATAAGFGGNVEFLVELIGKKSRVGIDTFLARPGNGLSFVDLLQPYTPTSEAVRPDPVQKKLEEQVEAVRRFLAAAKLTAEVGRHEGTELFDVTLRPSVAELPPLPAGTSVHCWPITLRELDAVETPMASPLAQFPRLSFSGLTSFFAFRVAAEAGPKRVCIRFALNLPLSGAPTDRRERILRTLLSSPEQVLRFLMFLLSEFGADGWSVEDGPDTPEGGWPHWGPGATPLFEMLLKALDRSPAKLDQVARLVEDLRGAEGNLLPEGFDDVWQPVWEARQGVNA